MLIFLLVGFAVSLRFQKIQTFVSQSIIGYVNNTYQTDIQFSSILIELPLSIELNELLVKDHQADTLLFVEKTSLGLAKVQLSENQFSLSDIQLKNGLIDLKKYEGDSLTNLTVLLNKFGSTTSDSSADFAIKGNDINLKNIRFHYHDEHKDRIDSLIDFNHIDALLTELYVDEFEFENGSAEGYISQLKVSEQKGLAIQHLSGDVFFDANTLGLFEFEVQSDHSFLSGEFEMQYDNIGAFSNFIEEVELALNLDPGSEIQLSDVGYFASVFFQNQLKIKASGVFKGPVVDLYSESSVIQIGNGTELFADWHIKGLPNVSQTFLEFEFYDFDIFKKDIEEVAQAFGANFQIPNQLIGIEYVHYEGIITGYLNDLNLKGDLVSDVGKVQTDISFQYDTLGNTWFSGYVNAPQLALNKLLPKEYLLKTANIKGEVDGSYVSNHLNIDVKVKVPQLDFNGYSYRNLAFNGKVIDKSYKGVFSAYDDHLSLLFNGIVNLNNHKPEFIFNLNLSKANLKALNLKGPDSLKSLSGSIFADLKGTSLNDIEGKLLLNGIKLETQSSVTGLNHLVFLSKLDSNNQHQISIESDNLNLALNGTIDFETIDDYLLQVMASATSNYIDNEAINMVEEQDFDFSISILKPLFLSSVFIPELKIQKPVALKGSVHSAEQNLSLTVVAPEMQYKSFDFSDFTVNVDYEDSILNSAINMRSLAITDSLKLENLLILSKALNNSIQTDISWRSETGFHSSSNISSLVTILNKDEYIINLFNTGITIDGNEWKLNPANEVAVLGKEIHFQSFEFKNNASSIGVEGWVSNAASQNLYFNFSDFQIKTITDLFKSENIRLSGTLTGKSSVANVYNNLIFNSEVQVNNLVFNNHTIGSGDIKATWDNDRKDVFVDGNLYGPTENQVRLVGNYFPLKADSNLNFRFLFSKFDIAAIQPLVKDYLSKLTGIGSGTITATGSFSKPILEGKFNLKQTEVKVDYLNSTYFIENEQFIIEPDWMGFNYITVKDERNQKANVVGTIFHENYQDFNFDVSFFANNFQMLNTNANQNPYYYGNAFVSGDINLSGYADNLIIETEAKTEKGTKLFIPTEGVKDVSQNEFISFVNTEKDTANKEDFQVDLTGIEMNFLLDVTNDAEIQIIFDETVGDIMKARGDGNIQLKINSNGDFNMYGDYIVTEGDYLFTLKNIINKRFRIRQGGSITWNGDPFEAKLDLTAYYKTRSSLADLNLPIDSSAAKRRVPVEVNLQMRNSLLSPDISFAIDLPSLDDNTNSLVRSSISTDEEVNRQVFSLLLLNRFAPPESGLQAGGAVGTTSSEMLANQLTNWLSKSKLSDYVEVGVNELSADEFEVALSKELFNDRLVVEGNFGSTSPNSAADIEETENNNIVGDFNVEYKIREDGKLRAKAFRKSNDFNMVNNNFAPYTEGIGLFYREDFNKWSEFFGKLNPFKKSSKTSN